MTDAVLRSADCASCGHPLEGRFCSNCGQQVLDADKLTLHYFLTHTVVEELFDVDSKIWRTLRLLLLRPGVLALEYAAGRRRPYINPLRVLIVAVVVYVLATQGGTSFTLDIGPVRLSLAPAAISSRRSIEATLQQSDRFGVLERRFTERFGSVDDASDEVRTRFNQSLSGFATPLSFTTVVLVALTLYACFYRRRPLLVEHAVFSMHYYSFLLLSLVLVVLVMKLDVIPGAGALAVLLLVNVWQFVYLATAIRRFYFGAAGTRRWLARIAAVAVAVVVYVLNSLYVTVVQFAGAAYAIWRL